MITARASDGDVQRMYGVTAIGMYARMFEFLHHILRDHGEDIQIDWRLLYHASAKLENRFDLTVPVWETVWWIQDTAKADEGSMERPLGFYGRSLQDYHNDTCAVGRRVERVRVSSSLAKIEVSFKFAELKPYPTEILALEFIDKDGTSMTVGSKDSEVDISKCRELFSEFTKSQEAKCRLDCAGLHALFDAQSFVGFRISYSAQAIYRIGILNRHHKSKAQPEILGYEPDGCSGFDMGLRLAEGTQCPSLYCGYSCGPRLLPDIILGLKCASR
jgi:hypothetical protein